MEKDNCSVKIFIPRLYEDRVKTGEIDNKYGNISDRNGISMGFYRFYGIYLDRDNIIGLAKYHLYYNNSRVNLDRIEINFDYQGCGYGMLLLKESIEDLITRFNHIKCIYVLSSPNAIDFYRQNGFVSYLGENNLVKNLVDKKLIKSRRHLGDIL